MHLLWFATQLLSSVPLARSLSLNLPSLSRSHALQVRQSNGVINGRASVWQPAVGTKFQMILYGILTLNGSEPTVSPDVEVYDLDLFETPKETITALHKMGKKVICYFSAGTSEVWRPDFTQFGDADLGLNLTYWPGERWLDIRSSRVVDIMKKRIALASDKGCDAVDPDDVDVFSNDNGGGFKVPVSQADSVKFFKILADESKKYNMAIGLKNSLEMLDQAAPYAQFAVNEECAWEGNCNTYADFTGGRQKNSWGGTTTTVGKPVFHVEYVTHYQYPIVNNSTTTNTTMTSPATNDSITASVLTPENSYTFIWSYLWPNVSDVTLLSTLCLLDNKEASKTTAQKLQLSTVLKEMVVDGWMMDCSGHAALTNVTPPNRTAHTKGSQPPPVVSSRSIPLFPDTDIDTAREEARTALEKREVVELPKKLAMKERKRAWRAARLAARKSQD